MKIRDAASGVIGRTMRETARRDWAECYPVVDGERIIGVVAADSERTILAGRGTAGAEYDDERQAWVVTPSTSAARALRAIPSAARVEQSRINGRRSAEEGKKGGRPRKAVGK